MFRLVPLLVLLTALPAAAAPAPTPPPAWASRAIWYQIFVERFRNGDPKNHPTPATMDEGRPIPAGWKTTPWTSDWYAPDAWATGLNHNANLGFRRYGGDLQGVLDKLDYLQKLGVTALFFNPLNDAPSLHKYDARHYHHIDVSFGPDPAGDLKLMAAENSNDPNTWVWTAADRQFLKLIDEVHKRGMRLILDYSWNHTGTRFWAWQDILQKQKQSAYCDWYAIKQSRKSKRINSGWYYLCAMLAPLALSCDEVTTLTACSHHARHARQRRRAQAVLGHHRGQTLNQLAAFFAVRYATVHGWLTAWNERGLAGLLEGKRSGRPPKLPPAAQKK